MKTVAVERPAEMIRRGDEELPEHLRFPRSQGFWVDGMDVRIREKSETLEALEGADVFREPRNDRGIEDVAALHGGGHIQMVLDQEANFGLFFSRKAKTLSGGIERFEATGHVVFHGHSLAGVVKKQSKNQKIAAVERFPKRSESTPALVGRVCQFLQMLNRAERMFVHGVAMVKITNHKRVDSAKFRKNLHQ